MKGKRLHDILQILKTDLYSIQGVVKELADAALPYIKNSNREHTVLEKALKNAYDLVGIIHDIN